LPVDDSRMCVSTPIFHASRDSVWNVGLQADFEIRWGVQIPQSSGKEGPIYRTQRADIDYRVSARKLSYASDLRHAEPYDLSARCVNA
jgi:hypothetical protein